MTFHERIRIRESNGTSKWCKESILGDDYSAGRKKYVDKTRIIDRKKNTYYEKVTDKETGERIHECKEPLDQHWGHGSAKKSKVVVESVNNWLIR